MFFIHCFFFYTSKLGICALWLHFFEHFSEAKALSIIQAFFLDCFRESKNKG